MKLAAEDGGSGERLLVLLHGLSATRHVWHPMLRDAATHWNGSWIAPDLRGHGTSPAASNYSLGCHAADIGELVAASGNWSEVVLLGHSMGGAIALALGSGWFGFTPTQVFGLGIKVAWSEEDLAGMQKLATSPARVFATEDEALSRYLRVSGLAGLALPESEAKAGIVQREQGWQLACDPATASVGPPPMPALSAAAQCPIHLARGETDALVTQAQLLAYDADAKNLPGAGHNAMVEKPEAVWAWLLSGLHDTRR